MNLILVFLRLHNKFSTLTEPNHHWWHQYNSFYAIFLTVSLCLRLRYTGDQGGFLIRLQHFGNKERFDVQYSDWGSVISGHQWPESFSVTQIGLYSMWQINTWGMWNIVARLFGFLMFKNCIFGKGIPPIFLTKVIPRIIMGLSFMEEKRKGG